MSKSELRPETVTMKAVLRPHEAEIWCKVLKKSIESVLRRAILTSNQQINSRLLNCENLCESGGKLKAESDTNKQQKAPVLSTTLRRSYDIKISLSKLIDKRAYELLQKISGAFICHNCNFVNKHGVVTCDKSNSLNCVLISYHISRLNVPISS